MSYALLYLKGRKIRKAEANLVGPVDKIISDKEWKAIKIFTLLFIAVFVVTFLPILLYNIAEHTEMIISNVVYKLTGAIVQL